MSAARRIRLFIAVTLGLSIMAPALSQPASVEEERTDNNLSFTYDEASGEIGSQTSSRKSTRADQVSFEVQVTEADDAGPGLTGKLKLRLDGDQHTVYDGWFSMKVTEAGGDVYYQRFRPATIHLRPRPGQRTAALIFRFDLPSGSYRAIGSFSTE